MTLRDRLFRLGGVLVLLLSFVIGWIWMALESYGETRLPVTEPTSFVIEPGMHLAQVVRALEAQGVIEHPVYFQWLARLRGDGRNIQAGEYRIDAETTAEQLLTAFVSGRVKQYSLTLVEGWTFKEVMAAVRQSPHLRQTLPRDLSPTAVMAELGHPGEHPEGRFYPDTYHFPRGTTDVAFLQRAYDMMAAVLAREWETRDVGLPYDSPYEALIMASIVERETGVPDERATIAGVFVRRLQKNMRLQTDPTVIYGLGERYQGNLKRKHLKTDTPYNTYTRRGLTPTPIAMPSGDAIRAALRPAAGDELYFVAKGDGSHHFSATMEEHNRAVRKYQISNRPEDYRSRPES